MHRLALGLVAIFALTGCGGANVPSPSPTPAAPQVTEAPPDGVLLSSLGFTHAPLSFSIPREAIITDRIDAANNVTVVMSGPSGLEIAAYLREHLPDMGFEITADRNNSLRFNNGPIDGAFTTSNATSALSLRTDR